MKCRKPKCRSGGGIGRKISDSCMCMQVYECTKCGRRWAVGKLPRHKTTKPSSLEFRWCVKNYSA